MFLKGLFGLAWLIGKTINEPNNYHKNPYNTTDDFVQRMRKPFFDPELYDRINKIEMPKPPEDDSNSTR